MLSINLCLPVRRAAEHLGRADHGEGVHQTASMCRQLRVVRSARGHMTIDEPSRCCVPCRCLPVDAKSAISGGDSYPPQSSQGPHNSFEFISGSLRLADSTRRKLQFGFQGRLRAEDAVSFNGVPACFHRPSGRSQGVDRLDGKPGRASSTTTTAYGYRP